MFNFARWAGGGRDVTIELPRAASIAFLFVSLDRVLFSTKPPATAPASARGPTPTNRKRREGRRGVFISTLTYKQAESLQTIAEVLSKVELTIRKSLQALFSLNVEVKLHNGLQALLSFIVVVCLFARLFVCFSPDTQKHSPPKTR